MQKVQQQVCKQNHICCFFRSISSTKFKLNWRGKQEVFAEQSFSVNLQRAFIPYHRQ